MGRVRSCPSTTPVVVPVSGVTKATAGALVYATTISDDVRAVYVNVDDHEGERLAHQWEEWDIGVDLILIPSPFRSVLRPLVDYVEGLRLNSPGELVSVVVPEIVPRHWLEHVLHNKTALYIRTAFLFKPNVVVVAVPFQLKYAGRWKSLLERAEAAVTGTG